MSKLSQLKEVFVQKYGTSEAPIRVFHAPGRVNLIGEHIDYNGGYVFPAALTFGTTMLIRPRRDHNIRFASTNLPVQKTISTDDPLSYDEADDWVNYPKGVLHFLKEEGFTFHGCDVLYSGEIPNGAGLSSSASLEVVSGYGFTAMEGKPIDRQKLALISKQAENEFVGVNSGIMDQFAVAMGQKDRAILLMCDTLEYQLVPFHSQPYKLVIGNTNKRRGLLDSAYNTRREQCEAALSTLQEELPQLNNLCELSPAQWEEHKHRIADETIRRRAQHVIEENARVLQSMKVLEQGDLAAFGELMNQSHISLRDLYEVTGAELDAMVEAAWPCDGVLGARMTGAGFGGCTVSLVHEDNVDAFIEQVGKKYTEATGLSADFYVCEIGDGVKEEEAKA